jgi:AAA domain
MTHEQKKQVRDALIRYVNRFDTQTKAAATLHGISTSTISMVKNNNWEHLSDRLWFLLARQVGFFSGEWQAADTSVHMLLGILLGDAQRYGMTYGISIGRGLGKTFAASRYTYKHESVFYVDGAECANRRTLMTSILNAAGIVNRGSVPDMMHEFTVAASNMDEPLIIIDDAHRLKDRALHFAIQLANTLAGNAGIVLLGDSSLRERVIEGVRTHRTGFDDIYKAIGRRFITLGSLAPRDVELVCHANSIHDKDIIEVIEQQCNNNLHTVTTLIHEHREMDLAA